MTASLSIRKMSAGCLDPYGSGDHYHDRLAGVLHGVGAARCSNHASSINGGRGLAKRIEEDSLMTCLPLLSSLDPRLVKRSIHRYRKLQATKYSTDSQHDLHHDALSTGCSMQSIGQMRGPVRGSKMQQESEQVEFWSRRSAEMPQGRNGRPGRLSTTGTDGRFDWSRDEVGNFSTTPIAFTTNSGEKAFPSSSHRTRVASPKLLQRPTLDSEPRPHERFVGLSVSQMYLPFDILSPLSLSLSLVSLSRLSLLWPFLLSLLTLIVQPPPSMS